MESRGNYKAASSASTAEHMQKAEYELPVLDQGQKRKKY